MAQSRSLFAPLALLTLYGCAAPTGQALDACAAANEHIIECTGGPDVGGPFCDPEVALEVLSQDCYALQERLDEPKGDTDLPAGACEHTTVGGVYSDRGCTAGYQCCDGHWAQRAHGCGECSCVSADGSGCSAEPPPPPLPGMCEHTTMHGMYADRGCTAGYQCCGGRWTTRESGCGECSCTKPDGSGCVTDEEPQDPMEPEEPQDPMEPEEPQDPMEPEEPQDPMEPEEPQDPMEPEEPQDPMEPEEPQDPMEPEEPQDPMEPEEPQDPMEPEEEPIDPTLTCQHSATRAHYANRGCTGEYQCCDGNWALRSGGCGACECVQVDGSGCGVEQPEPTGPTPEEIVDSLAGTWTGSGVAQARSWLIGRQNLQARTTFRSSGSPMALNVSFTVWNSLGTFQSSGRATLRATGDDSRFDVTFVGDGDFEGTFTGTATLSGSNNLRLYMQDRDGTSSIRDFTVTVSR